MITHLSAAKCLDETLHTIQDSFIVKEDNKAQLKGETSTTSGVLFTSNKYHISCAL